MKPYHAFVQIVIIVDINSKLSGLVYWIIREDQIIVRDNMRPSLDVRICFVLLILLAQALFEARTAGFWVRM